MPWILRRMDLQKRHSNHSGKVKDHYKGVERHFMLVGQMLRIELHVTTHTWTRCKSMLFARGHIIESSIPWNNCGFMIVSGSINNGPTVGGFTRTRTKDVSYCESGSDAWTSIGEITSTIPTPLCVIHRGYFNAVLKVVDYLFAVKSLERKYAIQN
jgi:hypothetical protein